VAEGTSKAGRASDALIEMFTREMAMCSGKLGAREVAAIELANELVRRWLEDELTGMASRQPDEVIVHGQRYRRHSSGTRRYHSLCVSAARTLSIERGRGDGSLVA
jgi:hypothetical protein